MRTNLLVVTSVAALAALAAPAQANEEAAQAARGAIRSRLPSVAHLFVNCPDQNAITAPGGSTGIGCEWRGLESRAVRTGTVAATLANGQWQAAGAHASRPLERQWRSCSRRGVGGHTTGQNPTRLDVYAVGCGHAKSLANDIARRLQLEGLRLPHHFTEARYGKSSKGFVVNTFTCSGKVRVEHESGYVYARETARCANRFGDRFVYGFIQSA